MQRLPFFPGSSCRWFVVVSADSRQDPELFILERVDGERRESDDIFDPDLGIIHIVLWDSGDHFRPRNAPGNIGSNGKRPQAGTRSCCEERPNRCLLAADNVLRGIAQPTDCKLFGKVFSPRTAVGPCMVSHEGACKIWHLYQLKKH